MNLESQVCSLELSKRLKELGVKQESVFYWADGSVVISIDMDLLLSNGKVRSFSAVNNDYPEEDIYNFYSAFTVAELGEMLPCYSYKIIKSLRWIDFSCEHFKKSFKCDTEADARAKMLIYLLENKLIDLKE